MQEVGNMTHKSKFFGLVALQIILLVCMIGFKYYTVQYGTKIMLKTIPVDPRDLFRGDYVTLRYEISNLNLLTIKNAIPKDTQSSESVYVRLYSAGKYYEPNYVSLIKPELRPNEVFIKGRLLYRTSYPPFNMQPPVEAQPVGEKVYFKQNPPPYDGLVMEYGIESYFIPEGQGTDLQRQGGKLEAKVSVDTFGNASLINLFLDNKEIKFQ
jgi:uncharacterized membrane-anchored protein